VECKDQKQTEKYKDPDTGDDEF